MQLQYNINVHSWTCWQKTFSNSCSHKVFFKTQQHDKKSKEFRTKIAWGKAVTTVLAFLWTPHGFVYDRFQLFSMCKWSVKEKGSITSGTTRSAIDRQAKDGNTYREFNCCVPGPPPWINCLVLLFFSRISLFRWTFHSGCQSFSCTIYKIVWNCLTHMLDHIIKLDI